jgi:fatty acid CoA ligase FadD9
VLNSGCNAASPRCPLTRISCRELWNRVSGGERLDKHMGPKDRVCMLGFSSVDYTAIDMASAQLGAVSVPLQTNAAIA